VDSNRTAPLTVMNSAQCHAAQVPRASCSSPADVSTFIDAARPVVITPEGEIRANRLQAPEDLRRAFDGVSVSVKAAKRGDRPGQAEPPNLLSRMLFTDFATCVENLDKCGGEPLYLSQFPLSNVPAGLRQKLKAPRFIPENCSVASTNLWFGPAGTVSPLHFDQNHNLLHQHYGHKHVVLVDPRQFHLLNPADKNSLNERVSSLDLVPSRFTIDLSPLGSACLETVLGPGDVLFVPAFWWHHVMSLDIAISVNHWWRAPISACLYPGLSRFLSSRFVYADPSITARTFDLGPHKLDTGLCLFLADRGHAFGAAALAGAMVTTFCHRALGLAAGNPDTAVADGSYPDFTQAHTVLRALAAHGLVDAAQEQLLHKWLELARETAAEPYVPVYSAQRARIVRTMILQLHAEYGKWLSM
jgi:hypothetical protein